MAYLARNIGTISLVLCLHVKRLNDSEQSGITPSIILHECSSQSTAPDTGAVNHAS